MKVSSDDNLFEHYNMLNDSHKDFRNLNLFHLIATYVRGKEVVDIGCGSAYFANILATKGKNVVGIEPNSDMRALAAQINPKVTVIPGNAEEIGTLLKEPVDTIVMIDVLEHVEKDNDQVRKVRTMLKNNGEFIFVVPAYQLLYGKRDAQMGHYRRYSKKALHKILAAHGFHVKHMRYWNALGVLPYVLSEKILQRPLESRLRGNAQVGILGRMIQRGLQFWFSRVENNFDFGFGLSIIGVAKTRL